MRPVGAVFGVFEKGKAVQPALPLREWGEEEPGVFETLRVYGKSIFRLDEHVKRLEASARSAGLILPRGRAAVRSEILRALAAWRKTAGPPAPGAMMIMRVAAASGHVWVWVGVRPEQASKFSEGAVLKTTAFRRSPTHASAPESKTNAYQNAVLAFFDPPPGPDERLFLDTQGFVAETSVGNIFLIKKKCLMTPPPQGILNGITRLFVLECARRKGLKAEEVPLTRHDFYNADEVFLTNTSWEILPVREIDGRSVGHQVPGPWTRKLHQTLKRRIQSECRSL